MVLFILRGVFIVLAAAIAVLYVVPLNRQQEIDLPQVIVMLLLALGISAVVISIDTLVKRKKLSAISGVILGLLAGLVVAWALGMFVDLYGMLVPPPEGVSREGYDVALRGVKMFIGVITCYLGMSLVLQTKDDFRFVIPYVEFAKQVRGTKPIVVDTSVIIDGRIVDVIETQILQGTIVIPKFVLNELQIIADSPDKLRRARGRRGLDMLQKLQENTIVEVLIDESEGEGSTVDHKLITLAQTLPARVMTNDYNLNKIATLRGVEVINLNELAKALRPVALPGEVMIVKVVKAGESASQGVGYLDDGTMLVVENARRMVGREIEMTVTSTLQTSAGRMIFGRYSGSGDSGNHDTTRSPDDSAAGTRSPDDSGINAATTGSSSGRNPRRNS